ncbi:4Fe-4S ferredoxin, partial [candidate division GN15 bacterium]|nr:4Fe-4S ferredoxin [candidate division GN15 bacterium]
MGLDRRKFIKVSGLTALALAGGKGMTAFGQSDSAAVTSKPEGSLENPLTAKRWAMVVNLSKCREADGCTACINACHKVHNVPDFGNPKDEIKWIWKEHFEHAFHDHKHDFVSEEIKHTNVPLLCNHCDNPPCTRVCPTEATWKRESDGLVMMDWHRC